MRASVALTLAVLATATTAEPAAAQFPTPRATLDRPTPIAAHGDWLAWSRYDGDAYRLVLDAPGVRPIADAPVAARSVPFDVDLGPGPDGGIVASYSRCAEEADAVGGALPIDYDEGEGCDVHVLDLATGQERKLAGASTDQADETWPSIWRDEVAFVRSYDRKPDLPYLYTRPLAGGTSRRQPGGTRQVCSDGRCTDRSVSRPYALELHGRRLAFGWTYAGGFEGLETEIRLDTTTSSERRRIADQAGGGLTSRNLAWPAFHQGRVFFSRACFGDTSGCVNQAELRRYRISTRATDGADADKAILAHDRDESTTFLLVDRSRVGDCRGDPAVPGGTCELRASLPSFGP